MLLVEVAHADSPQDLSGERQRALDLVAANRLYRQTAERVGDTGTVAVLDQLERVLLELAHQPESATPADLRELRRQIESGGLLFKVRVVQLNVKDEMKDQIPDVNSSQARPTI
jgi:plasmid stabilization system protein ParE